MYTQKVEGYISAIEGEAKQPQPSHANLARLIALVLREIAAVPETVETSAPAAETIEVQKVEQPIEAEKEPEKVSTV